MDTGPLYAAVNAGDENHERAASALQTPGLRLIVPAMVVAEVSYLLGRRLGPEVDARFLAGLSSVDVVAPQPDDWRRIAELVRTYRGFPLGGTDASVIVAAERFRTDLVVTLDRRHFAAVRPRHVPAFRLLPE